MWRSGRIRPPKDSHNNDCKCGHPRICHYTKEGNCVYQACECKEFKAKGRPEYSTAKRSRCQYGHSHDSGLEVKECWDLSIQKQAGSIRDFSFHPVVDLPGPSGNIVARYEVDFRVEKIDGSTEWVECKGDHLAREQGWRIKWALLQDKYKDDPKYSFRVVRG